MKRPIFDYVFGDRTEFISAAVVCNLHDVAVRPFSNCDARAKQFRE